MKRNLITIKKVGMFMENKIEAIILFAKQKLAADKTGHNMDHLTRVAKMSQKLSFHYHVNEFITISAAYLHDVIDDKLVSDPKEALADINNFLIQLEIDKNTINQIIEIITHMSYSSTLEHDYPLSLEGQIVQDADWLDAIGAVGIMRAIYFGGHHGINIYDPQIKPRTNMTKKEIRDFSRETVINHFYEKLLLIKDKLNTKEAKKIAAHRQEIMLQFLSNFKSEWDAKS